MVNEKNSPASLARTLADSGGDIVHPDVIDDDVRWRSSRLFTAEELSFDSPAAAVAWMENFARENNRPRETILSLKRELELIVASPRTTEHDRQLAREIGQWLAIWLQNPGIFLDWFALRQNAAEFRQLFGG
ncbi:MAG TPA: hypothetical protein VJT15_09170 [Pyrinomonadaceae bacterium]|nr:hypothetical protein [Pyrinomonadaceae bacterium]